MPLPPLWTYGDGEFFGKWRNPTLIGVASRAHADVKDVLDDLVSRKRWWDVQLPRDPQRIDRNIAHCRKSSGVHERSITALAFRSFECLWGGPATRMNCSKRNLRLFPEPYSVLIGYHQCWTRWLCRPESRTLPDLSIYNPLTKCVLSSALSSIA